MADPISLASGLVALVAFALESSVVLYQTIRSFQSQHKTVRALKNELEALNGVLGSLLQTVNCSPDIDLTALKLPLLRCGKACEEYGDLIARCTTHSTTSRTSFRDWAMLKYMDGDITDFKDMLAGYKSTINIALANANLHFSAVTPNVLEEYKDMIRDATADLQEHLLSLNKKVQELSTRETDIDDHPEWQAMLQERESTEQGLRICAQLSAHVEQLAPAAKEPPRVSYAPSAQKYIANGLRACKGSLQDTVSQLQSHLDDINEQLMVMRSKAPLSENGATQLAKLQQSKESISQCLQICSDACENATLERCNVYEDITMADDSHQFMVSTVGDLIYARRINLGARSRLVSGQMSDETIQTIARMGGINETSVQQLSQDLSRTLSVYDNTGDRGVATAEFHDRYGPGFKLSPLAQGVNPPNNSSSTTMSGTPRP